MYSDVGGPMKKPSIFGASFFVSFKDDASGFRFVYFLRHKSDVFEKYKELDQLIQKKYGHSVQILQTDNGGEYVNNRMSEYLKQKGTIHETTTPYNPQ